MSSQTRFFCRCGRLLTAEITAESVVCPTCSERNQVPGATQRVGPPGPLAPEGAATGTSTAVLERRPGTVVAGYRILSVIARGGMGTVYRAESERDGSPVALKILHAAFRNRPDFVSRFQREARAAASLSHRNIVRVLDSGVDGNVPFLVMELLEGQDLMSRSRQAPLSEPEALDVMFQAAAGLENAASQGITHRDIKPTNLVLQTDGVLKIADFGLAKAADSESHLTVTGEVLGTPHYMSPEQGSGRKVDHRSDLYSLGATVYHLLCGAPPFEADTPVAVIMMHIQDEPLPLRQRAPDVSAGLEAVIHRLIQKDPDKRYPDYPTLVTDLKRVRAGKEPLHGAPPPAHRVRQGQTTFLMPHEQATELVLRRVGRVRRLVAFFLDLVVVQLFLWLLTFGAGALVERKLPELKPPDSEFFSRDKAHQVIAAICLLAAFGYFAASDSSGGRTFGKNRLRLRVCRRDGTDLGPLRGALRTLLLYPGIVLVTPVLAEAVVGLIPDPPPELENPQQALAAGGIYLVAIWILGLFALGGRPLHDAAAGSSVYRAHQAQLRLWRQSSAAHPKPSTAAWLSLLPGVGLMYAGRVLLGFLFMILVPTLLFGMERIQYGFGLWVVSAFLSHQFARRRAAEAARKTDPHDPRGSGVIHRQET